MAQPNTLTDDEKAAGFRLLFDGKTTAGWRTYNRPAIDPKWQVDGDALRFHPDPSPEYGHDIVTEEVFTSFELRIDWKLWARGNSGIFWHIREADGRAPYESGPEYQLLDDTGHPDAANGPERLAGACYALIAPGPKTLSPLGEWNRTTIIVEGDAVRHFLNGQQILAYTMGDADWNRRVAASKFADWPSFTAERRGRIMLQDHKDPVAFRNIRIRPL